MTTGKSGRPERFDECLRMVQAEYLKMPGLHLTRTQIQRLWHLDDVACDAVLETLVGRGFLRKTPRGAYVLDRG